MRLLPVALWLLPEAATDVMQCKISMSKCLSVSGCQTISLYMYTTFAETDFYSL